MTDIVTESMIKKGERRGYMEEGKFAAMTIIIAPNNKN